MKKLTEITCEDAIVILSKIYPLLFVNKFNENNEKDWKLINCDDIEPGCKKLFNENKIYCFYFYCDSIEIDYVNEESTNNIMTYDILKWLRHYGHAAHTGSAAAFPCASRPAA